MTPLERILRDMIAEEGPIGLDRYMTLCLSHPRHGYYMTRDPLGRGGDFITAPEISQVFGELIGVWCMNVWHMLDRPRHFALAELGPGRGTLMADVLRVLAKDGACRKAAAVHFVETSPVLRGAQKERVPEATWHANVASLPAAPTIIIANEFFDALPIRQFERRGRQIFERCIGLEDGRLAFGLVPSPMRIALPGEGIFEDSSIRDAVAAELGDHLAKAGGAALVFDYGHDRTSMGDTLQAMRGHGFASVLEQPGEADLTSHVDFEGLARGFVRGGGRVAGLISQEEYLARMGIAERTEALSRTLSGEARQALVSASERLAHPAQMGQLFRVMAVTGRDLVPPYPFGAS